MILDKETLRAEVRSAMRKTDALDLWTNLPPDPMSSGACHGIGALIAAQEELAAQARALGVFLPADQGARSDVLFQTLFIDRTPLSDAAAQVLLTLERLGMPLGTRDVAALSEQLQDKAPGERMEQALDLAKLRGVACVVDPFAEDAGETLERLERGELSPRLLPALSVETLQAAVARDEPVRVAGAEIERDPHGAHVGKIAEVLAHWAKASGARMVRASWPGESLDQDMLMRYAVLPLCEAGGLPVALALSGQEDETRRQLAWVGEALERSSSARFVLVARTENGAKALMDSLPALDTRVFPVLAAGKHMAKESLGASGTWVMPYASGAGVLEQTIGGWVEARREIAQALYDRYLPLIRMGWGVRRAEIESDVARLLGGNWEEFCKPGRR